MAFELKSKVALVTGGSEGIGLAIVERLLKEGCKVMIANRNVAVAEAALVELKQLVANEADVAFVKMDLCNIDDVRAAFTATVERFGTIDIVVANAGFTLDDTYQDVLNERDAGWLSSVQGNLISTMLLGRLAASYWLKNNKAGAFVASASGAAMHGVYPTYGGHPDVAYPVSKSGIVQFVFNLQGNMDSKGRSQMRFSTVLPGITWSNIWEKTNTKMKTKADVEADPYWGALLPASGGWVPMDKLVDAYVMCITDDEKGRGKAWSVVGAGGEAKPYPSGPFDIEAYISRA